MRQQPRTYSVTRKGLFFPTLEDKRTYKKFDGKRFRLDSWTTSKKDMEGRKQVIKESGWLVRVTKGKRLYTLWRRRK